MTQPTSSIRPQRREAEALPRVAELLPVQAEHNLRSVLSESEKRLRTFFDYAPVAIVMLGVVVRNNRKKSAAQIVDALSCTARDFTENRPQVDDITAVVVKVLHS